MPTPAAAETKAAAAAARAEHRAVLDAMESKERRQYVRAQREQLKSAIKAHRQAQKSGSDADNGSFLLIIVTIILPPLGVAIYEGGFTENSGFRYY